MINLLKMSPAETARVLNGTSLGQVMGERQPSRHLQRAGMRIAGDSAGRKISLAGYAAWLFDEITAPPSRPASYEERKEAARARNAETSRSGRDIGEIPSVADPERKEACRFNFKLFCESYFSDLFYYPWSPDHLKIISRIETTVLKGGLFALAMPRGSGKSTITETSALWAVLYGHKRFIAFICATEEAAEESLNSIKTSIELNDRLAEDFPEVCVPIRKLDGIANRCNGQLCQGRRTRIRWKDREIVLPTVEGSAASGAVVRSVGITGRVRGMKYKRSDGTNARPDVVIIDDPQDRESASSMKQIRDRLKILSGDILGLAGPGRKISGFMPCSVISPDDVADQILDPERNPDWNGERCRLCYRFPENTELWDQYAEIRAESLRKHHDIRDATAFYRKNRGAMDKGAEAAWPERFDPGEISAIQNIMNLKIKDAAAFFAEYQNDPLPEEENTVRQLDADEILRQLNGLKRGEVLLEASKITMFVDVMDHALYYVVCCWTDGFTGAVIDYGTYPKQRRREFTVRDIPLTLQKIYPDMDQEGYIFNGLHDMLDGDFLKREYIRQDGAVMKISRVMIDANWGPCRDIVYQFCRSSSFSGIIYPSHGKYVGAKSRPMSEYSRKPGDRIGLNWMIPRMKGRSDVRHVIFDANYWKSYARNRLQSRPGNAGSLTLWGRDRDVHESFASQMVSEYSVVTEGRGRIVDEWSLRPKCTENHWWDGVVGNCVAAAVEGSILPGTGAPAKKRRVRIITPP